MKNRKLHYVHTLSFSNQERLVGFFVLLAIAVLLALLLFRGATLHFFEKKINYYAYMATAEGLARGTPVRVSGIEVGRVDDITLGETNLFLIDFSVYERFSGLIRVDSELTLSRLGFIGQGFVDISAGSTDVALLPADSEIKVKVAPSIDELIAEAKPALDQVSLVVEKASLLMENIPDTSIGDALNGVNSILNDVSILSSALASQQNQDKTLIKILQDLQLTTLNLQEITDDINKDLPVLLEQTQVMSNSVTNEVQQIPELMGELNAAVVSANQVLRSLKNTWPISSSVPDSNDSIQEMPVQQINE